MAEKKILRVQLPGDMADGRAAGREGETPTLVPVLAVGMTCVPGGVCLMAKDTVAYPVGRCLAMYSPTQLPLVRMSEPLRSVRGISALAVSPNKKYLAAAENMADGYMPQITLFDGSTLERLATVTGPHVTSAYTSVSFSSNGSLLLAVGSDEARGTSTFHLWEWGASPQPRCSGTIDTGGEGGGGGGGGNSGGGSGPVLRAALDPRFDSNVLVMCARDVGLWRQSPNGFRRHAVEGVDLPPGASFLDLSTLPDGRFLLATSTRQVLVVDRASAHVALTTDRPILTVLGLPDGGVAVGTERGYLQLFRRRAKDDHDHYAIYSETRVPESAQSVSLDAHIRAMCADVGGDTLLCTTAGGGPTYQFNLAYARTLALTPEASSDLWEMLLPGAHEQSIVSASLAYKRDFLATASKDLTVRVWQTSPLRLVLTHMCHHSPLALSIDPYGRELVVAFVDCVRCYSVVEGLLVDGEELRHQFGPANPGAAGATTTTAPQPTAAALAAAAGAGAERGGRRGAGAGAGAGEAAGVPLDHCSLVKYSPTGAFIAAAGGPGGRHIYIFSTLTKRQVAVLTGHYEAVMDLVWSDDGAYLASTGEGAVFTWAADGFVRVQENTSKLYLNDAITATPDFKTLVVGDTTQGLRIMETLRSNAANNSADGDGAGGGGGAGGKLANALSKALGGKSGRGLSTAGGAAESAAATESGGAAAAGSTPDTPVFKVPGRASTVPIGPPLDTAHTGSFISQNRSKMQAVSRMTAMVGGGPPDSAAASAAAAMAGCELKLRSNFQTIIQPGRGGLAIAHCAPTLLPAGHGAVTAYGGYDAVVGAGVLGRVRVCPLRPRSNDDVEEYFLHASDVTQVVAHRDGRLVITTDASGTWMMSILLPPGLASAAAAASASMHAPMPTSPGAEVPGSPTRSGSPTRALSVAGAVMLPGRASMAGGLAALAAAGGVATHADRTALAHKLIRTVLAASEFSSYAATSAARAAAAAHTSAAVAESGGASAQLIVSVRAVDVQLLKENVRELKDRLAKFATEAEYKMYEREQVVRRELEGEVGRLRQEVEVLRADLAYTRATAADDANTSERTRENMTRDFERALQEQQDMFEKKLAAEIGRTDAAEREMQRLRAKFGRKLWQLDEEQGAALREAGEAQAVLQNTIEVTKAEAQKSIAAGRVQMETELRVDGELNEEELQRAADAAQKQIEEKDEAYLKLLAKHTLQSGLSAKTAQENERLRAEAEALRRENTRLAEQVMALTEELEAMQAAWADRDARQRQQDAEMKDMAFQMQQAQLFTSLATTRIKELNNELEPVRGARDEAQAQVATMEGVAQRQLERQSKVVSDNSNLQSRLDAANDELKQLKGEVLEREAYFKNFTTQLFRTVQDVPHHQWPTLFGRMIEDYHKGRDKASWARYLEADHGTAAHPPGSAGAGMAASSGGGGRNTSVSGFLGSSATTAAEFNEKINELHAQLMHTEKMLSLVTETKDKADKARRAVVSKLMADNLMVVQELNDTKRDLKAARELGEKRAIELADLRMSVAVAGGVAGTGLTGAGPSATTTQAGGPLSGAVSAADVGGLPQGPAGRAMARLPSRLGDPSRQQTSSNGQPSVSPRASDGMAGGGPAGSSGGGSPGPGGSSGGNGALLGPGGRSPSIPEHASVSQPLLPSSAGSQQGGSGGGGGGAPMVVTGDMPQGGWWLGECSPFELPASMDHIASNSLRRGLNSAAAGDSGLLQERPGTSMLQMSSRRPGTSAGVSGGGRPGSYSVSLPPGSARTAFTPPTPHGSLPPPRRPDTSSSSSLMAAAVSGAALQAYSRQQQAAQQQQSQDGQGGDAGGEGGGGGPAAPPSPSLANGGGMGGHGPRASSAGPPSGSITSRSGNSVLRSTVAFGAPPPHGPFGGGAGHSSATAASATGAPVVMSPGGGGGGAGYAGTHNMLSGQVRPSTPSKVTTLGAGFRSFVPMGQGQHGGGGSGGGMRGNSR